MDSFATVSVFLRLALLFNSSSMLKPTGKDFLHATALHLMALEAT